MNEPTSIAVSIISIVAAIAFGACYGCQQCEMTSRAEIEQRNKTLEFEAKMLRDGFVRKQNIGNSETRWEKP